jgi:hypothetical protein
MGGLGGGEGFDAAQAERRVAYTTGRQDGDFMTTRRCKERTAARRDYFPIAHHANASSATKAAPTALAVAIGARWKRLGLVGMRWISTISRPASPAASR